MLTAISEAGWGIFPVLLCGLLSVVLAGAFAFTLRREIVPLLAGFWITTLLAGCLGFVTGVGQTLAYVLGEPGFDARLVAEGVRESSHNLRAALLLAIVSALLGCAGGFRLAWRAAARG